MSMGVTTVEQVERGNEREGCLWNRSCPSRSPKRSSVRLTIYSPSGTLGAPEHACAHLHTVRHHKGQKQWEIGVCRRNAAPNGSESKADERVPPIRGTEWLRNASKET